VSTRNVDQGDVTVLRLGKESLEQFLGFCLNLCLSLSPGVDPSDYYGEYEIPAYRDALLVTLKRQFRDGGLPFMFLDLRYLLCRWRA
jgi:hypothetical protein